MGFTLTLRNPSPVPLDVDGILPDRVAGLSALAVAKLAVMHGNRTEELGQFFDVSVRTSVRDADLKFAGDTRNVHNIGRRMTGGFVRVENDVGRHAGAQMSSGNLVIDSGADDWLGAEMRGGDIEVRHSAGNCVGAAYRGSLRGMTGGSILVQGTVGHELGLLMRRGMIVVGGDSGEFTGASMVAGTIVVTGQLGRRAGAGMKRGTILTFGEPPEIAPGLRYACEYQPTFLPLLLCRLSLPDVRSVRCYRGDVTTGGRGELLLAAAAG